MKCDPAINAALNGVLKVELTAINQTFLHARMLGNWGLEGLEHHVYKASIETMKKSDVLIKRILFLEGLPNLQDLGRLMIGEDVPEIIANDMAMQTQLREAIIPAMTLCEEQRDYQSREFLDGLLHEAEEEIDWAETQQGLIKDLGLNNYMQSQMSEED